MGELIDGKYYVNNHVHMVVDYHPMVLGEVRKIYVQWSALVCMRMFTQGSDSRRPTLIWC